MPSLSEQRQSVGANTAGFLVALLIVSAIGSIPLPVYSASSWNPTLLVNTEAFEIVDEGDSTTNIQMKFGQTLNETITYDRTNNWFKFSRGLSVAGNITGTGSLSIKRGMSGASLRVDGNTDIWGGLSATGAIKTKSDLTINSDADTNDVTLTFGNQTANQTLKYLSTAQKFKFSKAVSVNGNMSGSTLTVDGDTNFHGVNYKWPTTAAVASGKVLKVDPASGQLSWSADSTGAGGSPGGADTNVQFNDGGTTFNGTAGFIFNKNTSQVDVRGVLSGYTLRVSGAANAQSLTTTGSLKTFSGAVINADNDANDAILQFGNATASRTLKFLNAAQSFKFSTNLAVNGTLSGTTVVASGIAGNTFVLDGNSVVFDATNNKFGIRAGTAPHSTLTTSGSLASTVTWVKTATTLNASHQIISASGASAFTITLPTAVGILGRQYTIKKSDVNLANLVTISPAANETIDGLTSWVLSARDQQVTLASDGVGWHAKDYTSLGYNGYRAMGSTLNQWYTSPNAATALGNASLTATAALRLMPIIVEKVMTIDGIGVSVVTTVAASTARLGIYRDNGNMYPGALVVDVGTVATTAANAATICPSGCTATPPAGTLPVTLQPGLYWLAVHHSAHAITIRGFAIAGVIPLMGFAGALNAASPNMAYIITAAQAALPNPCTAGATLVTAAPLPAIFIRASK